MLARVYTAANFGMNSFIIKVEVDVYSKSLPSFRIVGLPDKAVEESTERVRSALKNINASFPKYKTVINLSPANIKKQGASFDLPIAVGLMIATGQIKDDFSDSLFVGELSLSGVLQNIGGVLGTAILAKQKKFKNIYLPRSNAKEASAIAGINVFGITNLKDLILHLTGEKKIKKQKKLDFSSLSGKTSYDFDMGDIIGQESAKRAITIAAAGSHNILMYGPPGAGKTLLARTIPSILPSLTYDEAIEVSGIYSISGHTPIDEGLITKPPFRAPHHSISRVGMVGGGSYPKPGEISLAHRGVLFLDEFPEFARSILESLRQPIEDGVISVSRAAGSMLFPSRFLLVAAANPCPCGYYGSDKKTCQCSILQIKKYQQKMSGPIIDRIDLHLKVAEVEVEKLISTSPGRSSHLSDKIRDDIRLAREIQHSRFKKLSIKKFSNQELSQKEIKKICSLSLDSLKILHQAVSKMGLSARAYYKIIKVARTIADLEASDNINTIHIAEAIQYRQNDFIS